MSMQCGKTPSSDYPEENGQASLNKLPSSEEPTNPKERRPRSRRHRFIGGIVRYHEHLEQRDDEYATVDLPRWAFLLGADELYKGYLYRSAVMEFICTMLFMLVHFGIINHCVVSKAYADPVLPIALWHFVVIFIFILTFAPSSGAHFNPLVTWATTITGHTPIVRAAMYTAAQMLGSITGAAVFRTMAKDDPLGKVGVGLCRIGEMSLSSAFSTEFFFSLAILFVIYSLAFDPIQSKIFGPVLAPIFISAMYACNIFATAGLSPGYSGAAMNPAVCFGPAVISKHLNYKEFNEDMLIHFFGPMLAAVVHGVLFYVIPPNHRDMYKEE